MKTAQGRTVVVDATEGAGTAAHPRIEIRLPDLKEQASQDQEWFEATIDGKTQKLRIHDYDLLYSTPGLYDALVYKTLKCNSPNRVVQLLTTVLQDWPTDPGDLRVLDLGAGNGAVAEVLRNAGVRSIVGLDLLPEAEMAARRDRPKVYKDYVVADLTKLTPTQEQTLRSHDLNAMITVAALGFGDIPPLAFANAFNLVSDEGWLAMTIKEDFLHPHEDDSGFAKLVQQMIADHVISMEAHLRYSHRISVTGEKLFYVAAVARKLRDIPDEMVKKAEQSNTTIESDAEDVGHMATILGQE